MSSPEAVQRYIAENERIGQKNSTEINRIVSSQIRKEQEIIQNTSSFCPNEQLTNRTLRGENIQEALNFGIGDGNVLMTLMCINNSAISFPRKAGFGRNYKIWRYFNQLRQIGTESVSGYAFSTGVREISKKKAIEDPFVVKSPRKNVGSARYGPLHEYFVGAFGTNSLRNFIPNFSFMFGYFLCSPPFIGKKYSPSEGPSENVALTFCQNLSEDNQVMYLIYERVKNSRSLKDFISQGCTPGEFLNVLTQIVLALNFAYQRMGFSHNDLHAENILIRELRQPIDIGYPWIDENKQVQTWYLRTSWIATFIDYGRSVIRYPYQGKEEYFGFALPKYGLYPNRSYPMGDIYKICMSSLASALYRSKNPAIYLGKTDEELLRSGNVANPEVYKLIKTLLPYFKTEAQPELIAKYVLESQASYFTFPYYQEYDQAPVKFFQNVLLKQYPDIIRGFSPNNPRAVYGCAEKGACLSLEKAIQTYTLMDDDLIADPYTFWEIVLEQAAEKGIDISSRTQPGKIRLSEFLTEDQISIGRKYYLAYLNSGLADLTAEVQQYQQLYQVFETKAPGVLGLPINSETAQVIDEYVSLIVQIINSAWIISQILGVLSGINRIFPDLALQRLKNLSYAEIVNRLATDYLNRLKFVNPLINELQQYGAAVQKLKIPRNSPVSSLVNRLESLIWSIAPIE